MSESTQLQSSHRRLVLASGSRYRAGLLQRLRIDFEITPADIDETAQAGESGLALARRLSLEKARHIQRQQPDTLVIGADQTAVIEATADSEHAGRILGKPGNPETAVRQLQAMRGHTVHYHSGLALLDGQTERIDVVTTTTRLRPLSDTEILAYLEYDQPFDCAGSLRSESLGISLLDELSSDDPTALIGLPLIRLSQWLRELGLAIP
ncbi:MAG: Maf family nucleotide pyrophosphatase [Pseudomonadota bacterium]